MHLNTKQFGDKLYSPLYRALWKDGKLQKIASKKVEALYGDGNVNGVKFEHRQ